jgi:hypothetical protein
MPDVHAMKKIPSRRQKDVHAIKAMQLALRRKKNSSE